MDRRHRRPTSASTLAADTTLDLTDTLPTAKVSAKAAAGWRYFADNRTCSYSAMVEAIGRWLWDNRDVPIDEMDPNIRATLHQARDIFQERRRRQPNNDA